MGRKQGVILSYILMTFEVISTLLINPFLIMVLGQEEYGVYRLSASLTAYLLLLDLGVGNAIIRYMAKYRANKDIGSERKFFGVVMIFYAGIAILSVIGGAILIALFPYVFSKGLNVEEIVLGQKLLFVTIINVSVTIGTTVYTNIVIAHERFAISKGVPILQIILRVLLIVVTLKLGIGSIGVVTVNLLMTILCRGFFVIYVFMFIKLRPIFKGISFDFIRDILIYSVWILVQMIATQINASMDQILLGVLVSSSAKLIAVYSIGTQIVQYFQSIGSAFNGVLMPGVVRMVEKDSSSSVICDEMVRIGRIIFMVLGLIWSGFLAFGRQFIDLWVGSNNADSYYVSVLLMTVYLFIMTESIGSQILWAKNEHKEQALMKLGIVLLNVFLTIVLIRWNPLIGAAIGTFISLAVGDIVIMNIVFVKKIKISLKKYYAGLFKGLLFSVLTTTLLGAVISLLPFDGWIGLIVKIGFMCVVYSVLLWSLGMNEYEKSLLTSLLRINWSSK